MRLRVLDNEKDRRRRYVNREYPTLEWRGHVVDGIA
jgi:hypothetical protein